MRRLAIACIVVAASVGGASAQTAAPATPAPAGDVEAGMTSFKKCLPCHSIGKDAKNKVGPELNGLDGRHSGTAPGYNYTDANKNSGITWNAETFREYIKNPRAKIPNTKMVFAGIKVSEEAEKAKTDEITNLWAYISQFNADGKTPKDLEEEKKAGGTEKK
jgi:cytochrome c